jgi:uncharacterized protein (TIGR00266 family)
MMRISNGFCRKSLEILAARRLSSASHAVAPIPPVGGSLVDFQTSAKIEGEETQVATITLQPGQTIRAESGSLVFMTSSIQMETSSSMSDGMKRFFTGQALFATDFTAVDQPGQVALAPAFPSKVLRLNLDEYGGEITCQKGAYVASNVDVSIELAFAKNLGTGFFGGEGFVLQRIIGEGDVLLQASGALIRRDLEEGETLRVSSGTLVCFTNTVDYDVQMMPGFKNVLFGGEGLFVTTLKGPGTVWLQGMPPDRMISEIARRVPGGGIGFGVPIGSSGGEAAGGVGGADGAGTEGGGEEMVSASDATIEADRQATVATSGVMSERDVGDGSSPDALFGDAAPKESPRAPAQEDTFGESSQEPLFVTADDELSNETGFSEETTFSQEDQFKDDLADDSTSFSSFDEGSTSSDPGDSIDAGDMDTEGVTETAKNIFGTLWDLITGGND